MSLNEKHGGKSRVQFLTVAAVIAAMYAVLT